MDPSSVLTDLINFRKPLGKIKIDVNKLSWDENCEVILTEKILNKIINKYLNGVISETELIEWANLIESRESINFEKGKEAQIEETIFNIANPELSDLPLKNILEKFRN